MFLPREKRRRRLRVFRLWGLFAGILLLSFVMQFPTCYSFTFCGFYDPGTSLKGVDLLDRGYRPGVDFGYTHGLLSLEMSRIWFWAAGRTPDAYFKLVMLLEVFIALGLARLVAACRLSRPVIAVFCCVLPAAVIPDYLTLTHPLEALLIVLALADQAEGKRARALALLTLCVFAKPSMAYVYGFVLVVMMAVQMIRRRPIRARAVVGLLLPAAVTGVVTAGFLAAIFGIEPLVRTVTALAGTSAYAQTEFGFFKPDGMHFWCPPLAEIVENVERIAGKGIAPALAVPIYYLTTRAGIWMLSAAVLMIAGGGYALARLRGKTPQTRYGILVLTLAILHAAFVFGFYGWTQSWTYYAYMPFLGLALVVSRMKLGRAAAAALCVVALLSHTQSLMVALGGWQYAVRTDDTSGLFAWKETAAEWSQVRKLSDDRPALLMTHGYPTRLPPKMELPLSWFPETGIATPVEVERVLGQIRHVEVVIVWREYGDKGLWYSRQMTPAFAAEKAKFARTYKGDYFELWERGK